MPLVMPLVVPNWRVMPVVVPVVVPLVIPLMVPLVVLVVVPEAVTTDKKQPANTRHCSGQHRLFATTLRRQRLGESSHQKSRQTF